jgi:hypothetical protein
VQTWVTGLTTTQSPSSARKIYRVLHLVLDMAARDGRLTRKVAAKVNLPRPVKHEHRYLTHTQVEQLARAAGYPEAPSKHSATDTRTNEMEAARNVEQARRVAQLRAAEIEAPAPTTGTPVAIPLPRPFPCTKQKTS